MGNENKIRAGGGNEREGEGARKSERVIESERDGEERIMKTI